MLLRNRSTIGRVRTSALACLLGCLVVLVCVQHAHATLFLIGQICLGSLQVALNLVGEQLRALGVGGALDIVLDLCRNVTRYSAVGILLEVAPQLQDLIEFINDAGLDLPNRVPQLASMIQQLADRITMLG